MTLAAEVAREAENSRQPADRVLRESLRRAGLTPEAAALAAHGVFAWFRWRGFVSDRGRPPDLPAIRRALGYAERFAREPGAFDGAVLLDGAFPGWWRTHWQVTSPLLHALQAEPALWLRARPGHAPALAAELPGARAGLVPTVPDALRYEGRENVFRTRPFAGGRCEIQDVASQAVGVVCAPQPGEKWWDACAGEGGKTLHLCDQMKNRGVVWASDRSLVRLDVLRRRAARAKLFNLRITPWNGGPRPPTRTFFDGVLVDAPCSGIGTWHRNPHARWTTSPVDVGELASVQERLLDFAARAVRPGGRLIYAVCTLTREETAEIAAAFARSHPQFAAAPFVDPFAIAKEPLPQIAWEPQFTGGNGMFVAAWRRREESS